MKVLLLIDHFGSGGAQRQMSQLGVGLKSRGLDVTAATYGERRFFDAALEDAGIFIERIQPTRPMERVLAVRRLLKKLRPDAVIAFLSSPSIYVKLASVVNRRAVVVVSERTGKVGPISRFDRLKFHLHRLADAVVTNSESLKEFVVEHAPWLSRKCHAIRNGVDLEEFQPQHNARNSFNKVLVVGRMQEEKNALGLLEAVEQLRNEGQTTCEVDWYGYNCLINGQPTKLSAYYERLCAEIERRKMSEIFRLHDPVTEIREIYQDTDLFCLPSFFEGCPNALAEAMACGKAAITSDVCDNSLLVRSGENGFLFDPHDPASIAEALTMYFTLSERQQHEMGSRSRQLAEELFSPELMIESYVRLLHQLIQDRR